MKKLALLVLAVTIFVAATLVSRGQNPSSGNLVAPNMITEADLGAAVFPVYVDDNGKYGSTHSLVFGGVGRDFARGVVRVGEGKEGFEATELFWIDRYEKIDGKEGAARVYVLGEYGGRTDSRVFSVVKGATSTAATPEFPSPPTRWE